MHGFKRFRWLAAVASALFLTVALLLSSTGTASTRTQSATCRQHGTLSYGIAGAGIPSLDPNTIASAWQEVIQPLLYPALTKYTKAGTIVPDIATRWKSSADQKTWWFWLRHDVAYSDGRAFTSKDAVANILRVLDPSVPSQARGNIKDFRSVDAIGKYEIRIKLGSPSALVPTQLFDVRMSDLSDVSKLNTVGNGTGPYKVDNFVPNQTLTIVPNSHYFGPKPCFAKIAFLRQPDPTAMVTSFTGGKLGMIWQIPLPDVPKVTSYDQAFIVPPTNIAGAHVWELDTTSPPFNNVLVRQALSYAFDRQTMVKVALQGQAKASLANDFLNVSSPAYDKKLTQYKFNLAKAKQLFDKAGIKPGTTFKFNGVADRRPEWVTMAEILQQDLQKIGLNLKIETPDRSTHLNLFYPAGKSYPNYIIGNFFSLPPNPVLALGVGVSGDCECNWNNKSFDALYLKALGLADPAKRQSVLNQMQVMVNQQVPVIVIAYQTNIVAARKGITGVWEDASGNVHLENARFAH
jgi:peptide/nickel transport system substrate-binding protein